MKLIGYAYSTGRIDFTREDNPWAFARIDAGMKQTQKDRIRVDPTQAPVELRSAENNDEPPDWMQHMEQVLRSAESMYLQYKDSSGVLRFRRANHDAGKNKTFITLGNQDEFDLYASENWQNIRYLYAVRRTSVFFDVTTMFTHKETKSDPTERIEIEARLDTLHESGQPQFTFNASGSGTNVDIIEWRKSVTEGEVGRFAPENSHLDITVKNVNRPFTFLYEDRKEFSNHSYTFSGDKIIKQFERLIKKRLKAIEDELAEAQQAESESHPETDT